MARNANSRTKEQENGHRQRSGQQMFSQNPVNNLMYDWITVLHNKAEGINAYEKYIRDAEEEGDMESAELFRKFREQDIWQVKEIKQHMEQLFLDEEETRFAGRGTHMAMRSSEEEGEEA